MKHSTGFSRRGFLPDTLFILQGRRSLLEAAWPVVKLFPDIFKVEGLKTLFGSDAAGAKEVLGLPTTATAESGLPGSQTENNLAKTLFLADHDSRLPSEGYKLTSSGLGLKLMAGGTPGLLYGLISLILELTEDEDRENPNHTIMDKPAFEHRGFMLDVSRHFFKTEEILRILDLCLILRLNRFHWHLTDDQGWRIESRVYPGLHTQGGRRKPFRGDAISCSGYYTRDEISRVVAYAGERGITVIPEIDMPGHVSALLSAYPHLSCTETPRPVPRRPGIYPDVLCPGNERVYPFMEDIIEDVASLFPGPWIHLGGDEVPRRRWRRCARCRSLMQRENLNTESELQGYFMNRMVQKAEALGKEVMVWNEAVTPDTAPETVKLDHRAIMQFWREKGGAVISRRAFSRGRRTIFSDFWHLYLDYPHGMTSLKKTQGYIPGFTREIIEAGSSMIGLEAPLWTEYVNTPNQLYRMILPRLYAVSEMAWTGNADTDYNRFLKRIMALDALCRYRGYEGTPVSQADPGRMVSFLQIVRFVLTALGRIRL